MSSDDEQSEILATAEDAQNQGAQFQGFGNSAFLQYRVLDTELDSEAELVVLDRLNATEQLINRAIDDSGNTYRELEGVSDRLRALSPLEDRQFAIDAEFEIAQFRSNLSVSPQLRTSTRRNSLVNQRVSFFENMFPISSSTVTTTTTTTTPSSVTSPGGAGLGSIPSVLPPIATPAAPDIMQWLEYRIEFALDTLKNRDSEILRQLDEEDEKLTAIVLNDMENLLRKCEEYERIFNINCVNIEKERQRKFQDDIDEYSRTLRAYIVLAGGNNSQVPTPGSIPSMAPITTTPRLAKVEALKLPRFNGEFSMYSSFRRNFDRIIRCTNTPEDMWGHYLYLSLDEDAQDYAGRRESWQGKYIELWQILDSRYANRWTMAAEIIKSSFMSTSPTGDMKQIIKYMDDQIDCIRSIAHLQLSPEQLAINVLLLKLPEEFANAIRNGLRIKRQNKGSLDYKFSIEEFRDVANDTVMTWNTTTPTSTQKTTLCHTPLGQSTGSNGAPQGAGTKYKGRGRGRGGRNQNAFQRFSQQECQLCKGPHRNLSCPTYSTAAARRIQLEVMNNCPDCSRTKHQGDCNLTFSCRMCANGRHLDYLCPGVVSSNSS